MKTRRPTFRDYYLFIRDYSNCWLRLKLQNLRFIEERSNMLILKSGVKNVFALNYHKM